MIKILLFFFIIFLTAGNLFSDSNDIAVYEKNIHDTNIIDIIETEIISDTKTDTQTVSINKEFNNIIRLLEKITAEEKPQLEAMYLGTKGTQEKKNNIKLKLYWQ
jgi:aromatic ring-opening dioxygenase LigB subunit